MSYKTILVHVDDSKNIDARLDIATELACRDGAHLIGSAMSGVARFLSDAVALDPNSPQIAPFLETLRRRASAALDRFEEHARRNGVASFERALSDDEVGVGLSLQARYADLAILGQYNPADALPAQYAEVPEYVVMHSARPVLLVPHTGHFGALDERVLIAWNDSAEAARAVQAALPLLRRAKLVHLAIYSADSEPGTAGVRAGSDIALYLARHDVKVEVMQEAGVGAVGEALLSLAANLGVTMLVMGCYGHTRLREILLGGTTRTILKSMTLPVLMAH